MSGHTGHLNPASKSPPDNVFPGEGREPLVSKPCHAGGQEDQRNWFDKPNVMPPKGPASKLDLGRVVGKK